MNISYISGSYFPSREANSIQVMRMAHALVNLKHQVLLYGRTGEPIIDSLEDYYGVQSSKSARFVVFPRGRSKYGREFKYALSVRRHIRGVNPDLVYGRHLLSLFVCSDVAPFIYEVHSMRAGLNRRIESMLVEKKMLRGIVTISEQLANDFCLRYSPKCPVIVEPDAAGEVDYALTSPASLEGNGKLTVGYAGHLYAGRGVELLLEVASLAPNVDFHFVGGEASDVARYRELASNLANVFFHGFVSPSLVPSYLMAFDILAAPYQLDLRTSGGENTVRWMSPMKLFEYMASGRPILISDLPVLREILNDRETAFLLPPEDPQAWADAILTLEDEQLRSKIGDSARSVVNEKYTWEKRCERILKRLVG